MSLSHIKTPMAQALPAAIKRGVETGAALNGSSLPCEVVEVISRAEVRVKFNVNAAPFTIPEATCSVFMWEYVRVPIQVGCKGQVISADAYLGGTTGAGGGTPTLATPGNLGALTFLPLGSMAWEATEDGVLTLYGVEGVTILNKIGGDASVKLTDAMTTVGFGDDNRVEVSADGVNIVGVFKINGDEYLEHKHGEVQAGGDESGGVV